MKFTRSAFLALVFAAGAAQAADPTAVISASTTPLTFAEYAGSTTVGNGRINEDVLYFIDEKSGPLGKSWYVFFEPLRIETVTATITFSDPISTVVGDRAGLLAGNATYGANGVTYGDSLLIGLEASDGFSVAGNTLTLTLMANTPGDHIRVFTSPVPEPASWGLMAAGLFGVGAVARRRRG